MQSSKSRMWKILQNTSPSFFKEWQEKNGVGKVNLYITDCKPDTKNMIHKNKN